MLFTYKFCADNLLKGFFLSWLLIATYTRAAEPPLQLEALITQAIQTYPSIESAKFEQQATTENIRVAKLNLLPTPSISAGYGENNLTSQIRVRQPLWTGGKLTANVNQAIFTNKAATEHIYEQQNQVAKNTIEAWQSYIQAIAKQIIHLKGLDELNDFEQMMQRRVGQGVSARIELDLVTNRILQEQNAYQAAIEQQRIAIARLEQIIGHSLPQNRVPNIKDLVERAKRQSTHFEKLAFNQASFHNPTVVREYFQIESAKQGVEAQQAALYPTVYTQYEHSYRQENNNMDDRDDGGFSVGLSYDPGAGFSNLASARASQAQVDSLIQNQEATRRRVMEGIQILYQQFISTKDRETSLVAAVAGAQIVVSSYRRQFIAGHKSWLEVLNAVREHNEYQVQLAQTRADMLGAFYKLEVEFGLMSWQQFAHNREPVTLFHPIYPVKEWLSKQTEKRQSLNLSYVPEVEEVSTNSRLPAIVENNGITSIVSQDRAIID